MDLDDGFDGTTTGVVSEQAVRHFAPFLKSQQSYEKQQLQIQLQQQQIQQQQPQNGVRLRHNSALAVSIETDV